MNISSVALSVILIVTYPKCPNMIVRFALQGEKKEMRKKNIPTLKTFITAIHNPDLKISSTESGLSSCLNPKSRQGIILITNNI
mgnify:CR=1 FL=1